MESRFASQSPMIAATLLVLLALAGLALAWIDLRWGIIPDWLNLLIACAGLAWAWLSDSWDGMLAATIEALIIGTVVFAFRWLYFRFRGRHGLGLGDVKLLAASAIWIGVAGICSAPRRVDHDADRGGRAAYHRPHRNAANRPAVRPISGARAAGNTGDAAARRDGLTPCAAAAAAP
jgi:hypothetical protein